MISIDKLSFIRKRDTDPGVSYNYNVYANILFDISKPFTVTDAPVADFLSSLAEGLLLSPISGSVESYLWDTGEQMSIKSIDNKSFLINIPLGTEGIIVSHVDMVKDIAQMMIDYLHFCSLPER